MSRQDGRVTIRGRGDDFVTDVIQCLSENGIRVTDFRTVLPTLEDVFLTVTGHSIRTDAGLKPTPSEPNANADATRPCVDVEAAALGS